MRVEADTDQCCGSGICVVTAPAIFGEDEDGYVRVLQSEPATGLDEARAAADRCPTGCITVHE